MPKLYDLMDILYEFESTKFKEQYFHSLSYYASSTGIIPTANKLHFKKNGKIAPQHTRGSIVSVSHH